MKNLIISWFQKKLNVVSDGLIPIGINSWNGGWEKTVIYQEQDADEQYPDDFARIDDWLPFAEAVSILKEEREEKPEEVIFQAMIAEAARQTADKFSKVGLRHESVTWLCHNFSKEKNPDINSFGQYGWRPVGNSIQQLRKNFHSYLLSLMVSEDFAHAREVRKRADKINQIKLNRILSEIKALMGELGYGDTYRIVDMTNHLDETVGWTEYNLETMTFSGYTVTCLEASDLGLGNCACNNHDSGYDFEFSISILELNELMEMLKKEIGEKNSFAKLAEEYPELAGDDLIIATTKTQYGNEITSRSVKFTAEAGTEWGINCYSSGDFDLGTCQCQSHNPTYQKSVSAEECRVLIQKYLELGGLKLLTQRVC